MSWSPRRKRTVAALVGSGVAILAAAALLGDGPIRACPAIGYADVSPITLEFQTSVEVDAVAACFGSDCQPVRLAPAGNAWSVPQSAEYLQSVEPGSVAQVKVDAAAEGTAVVDDVFQIDSERVGWTSWPSCPGPHRYLPVMIEA